MNTEDWINLQQAVSLMEALHELVGLPLALREPGGQVLAGAGWQGGYELEPAGRLPVVDSRVSWVADLLQEDSGKPGGQGEVFRQRGALCEIDLPVRGAAGVVALLSLGAFRVHEGGVNVTPVSGGSRDRAGGEAPAVEPVRLRAIRRAAGRVAEVLAGIASAQARHLREAREARQALQALAVSQERLQLALDSASEALWELNPRTGQLYVSPRWHTILGYDGPELLPSTTGWIDRIHPEDRATVQARFDRALATPDAEFSAEYRMRIRTGGYRWVLSRGRVVQREEGGAPTRVLGTLMDVHELKEAESARLRLEAQLRQSQKLEAIGALAGGIAHDFNNILGAIIGFTDLARLETRNHPGLQDMLVSVLKASDRARELVHQILSFTRVSKEARKPIRLQPVVKEGLKLLRSTLPTTLEIRVDVGESCPPVVADPTQIHQVLMNLCTNAAHAMRDRPGRLEVSLTAVEVTADMARGSVDLRPGGHVRLTVADTGHGMDAETRQRVFEPFFTTKGPGEGTGLGLAVVHGIVTEYRGAIRVRSTPGQGSVFDVYFPAAHGARAEAPSASAASVPQGTGQRILFVDDEAPLGRAAERMLKQLGYRPVVFSDPRLAWECFQADPGSFDLLLTDLTMPGMTGVDLAARVRQGRPDLPILLVTGFSGAWTPEVARRLGIREVVLKPLTVAELAGVVHRVLQPVSAAPA